MRKQSRGFTLVEVTLFLAITGALFIGIAGSVQNLLSQQRNNDAVQDFMEFLRRMYSEVDNVQNPDAGGGQSNNVFYGKLITFGESLNLAGEENVENEIFSYTIVGNENRGTGSVVDRLKNEQANVVQKTTTGGIEKIEYWGLVDSYITKWGAEIQKACTGEIASGTRTCEFTPFVGSLLIVRHPSSGNVYTYYSSQVAQVNRAVESKSLDIFKDLEFQEQQIDFCINVTDRPAEETDERFDVRILENAHGASGVEYIPDNNAEGISGGPNKCTR